MELPGHGESPFKSTKLYQLAGELSQYVPSDSVLVGWSLGASVLLLFAEKFPEKVKKLILFAPTLKFSGISQPDAVVKRFLKKLNKNFQNSLYEFRKICSEVEFPLPSLLQNPAVEILEDFCNFDLSDCVKRINVPVEIYVGQKDAVTGVEGALQLFLRLRKAEVSVYPDADHLTILWKPFS